MADQEPIPLDYGTIRRGPFWPRIWIVWIGLLIGFAAILVGIRFTHHVPRPSACVALPATTRPQTRSAVEAVRVRKAEYGGNAYTIVEVDLARAALRLFWKKPNGERFGQFAEVKAHLERNGEHLLFATNAGIFDTSFTPCGLHVEDGRERVPLNLRSGSGNFFLKPNGVLLVDASGARIIDATKYHDARGVRVAVQSGPLLALDGKIHPAFKPGSDSLRTRSGVGVVSARSVVFALSDEPVNFHSFAKLFLDDLHCRNALYLDGVISRFYVPSDDRQPHDGDYAGILAVTDKQ
jgi:uncharacterized protein YigE (DUF2233 family)